MMVIPPLAMRKKELEKLMDVHIKIIRKIERLS
jgi:hypothetical protein